ncbi:MAG TPA: hypothetical protein PLL69_10855 [Gemmatimonadales bacterium]|nr:hypothetical protein [Gemmatimonadales bacterium]
MAILFTWHQRRTAKLIRDSAAMILRGEEQARAAIAVELHDNLGKRLYDLQLRIANGGHASHAEIGELLGMVRQAARQLHPRNLGPGDLVAVLSHLAEQVRADWGMNITFDLAQDCPAEGEVALALYRIAQEALVNAHRHGGASTVSISLQWFEDGVTLVVEDDGVGIGAGKQSTTGLGVRSMQERMRAVGGRLRIGPSTGGRGVRVEAAVGP